jgi:hypothetical protein
MDTSIFIINVFCLVDDWLQGEPKLRQRGPQPVLADSEVLTIEIVGEFLGIDSEKDLFTYFRRHYREFFPALREVHRTTFTRQAANLWFAKERLWKHLLRRKIGFDPLVSLVNSFR